MSLRDSLVYRFQPSLVLDMHHWHRQSTAQHLPLVDHHHTPTSHNDSLVFTVFPHRPPTSLRDSLVCRFWLSLVLDTHHRPPSPLANHHHTPMSLRDALVWCFRLSLVLDPPPPNTCPVNHHHTPTSHNDSLVFTAFPHNDHQRVFVTRW